MLEHDCEGAKFHSPRPRRVHRHFLPNHQVTYLCGTCRDNLDVYITMWEQEKGLDWETQRTFGNQIRRIANHVLNIHHDESS